MASAQVPSVPLLVVGIYDVAKAGDNHHVPVGPYICRKSS